VSYVTTGIDSGWNRVGSHIEKRNLISGLRRRYTAFHQVLNEAFEKVELGGEHKEVWDGPGIE
jgi:hypothetical protein